MSVAPGSSMIHELLAEIESSSSLKLFRVALLAALTIPDIAGALDSTDGHATRRLYERWFDTHVASAYSAFGRQYLTGADCYQYRCTLLHQGRSIHPSSRYSRTMFLFAKQNNIAYCGAFTVENGQTLVIDVPRFCNNIVKAAWDWLDRVENTTLFMTNAAKCMELFQLSYEA